MNEKIRLSLIGAELQAMARDEDLRSWFIAYGASPEQADELIGLTKQLPTQPYITAQTMKAHISSGVRIEVVIAGYRAMVQVTGDER